MLLVREKQSGDSVGDCSTRGPSPRVVRGPEAVGSITWEIVRNAESQALLQICRIPICVSQVPQVTHWHRRGSAKAAGWYLCGSRWWGQPRAPVTGTHAAVHQPASQIPFPASAASSFWQKDWGDSQSCYKQLLRPGVSYGPFGGPLGGPPRTWSLRARGGWFPISTPGKCFGHAVVSEAR